ncbi:MAG: efflux RND transporter periplasmic adaptor subunit [Hyphomicrobiales bacterium]
MIRRFLALAVFLSALPADMRAQDGMFPEEPLDCIVRPKDTIELTSEEEGVLTGLLVDRGDVVERGQVVARLDNRLQESAVDLARIRAESDDAVVAGRTRVDFRNEEFSRMTELHSKNVTSAASLDEAAVQLRLAELELKTAATEKRLAEAELEQAKLRLARREIRSPIDGIVERITASPGEFAHEAAPVMTLAELDPLHVEAYLPISLYPRTSMGQEAEITIGPPIDVQRTATVSAIDKIFDAASGTFGVRLDLPNADHQLPGGIKCGLRFHVRAPSSDEVE